jgi:prepilin-type N-terminal cleavage/methylation domain-containing protein
MKQTHPKGFTLLELIIGMSVFLILALGSAWLLIFALRSNRIIWDQLEGQADARRSVTRVVEALRRAETSSLGAYPIVSTTPQQVMVYANMNSDSFRERVRFFVSGTTLYEGITAPSGTPLVYDDADEVLTPIAEQVTNITQGTSTFYYYDESFTGDEDALAEPVSPPDVRMVRILLHIEKDPDKTPVPLQAEAIAHIRNLKTN